MKQIRKVVREEFFEGSKKKKHKPVINLISGIVYSSLVEATLKNYKFTEFIEKLQISLQENDLEVDAEGILILGTVVDKVLAISDIKIIHNRFISANASKEDYILVLVKEYTDLRLEGSSSQEVFHAYETIVPKELQAIIFRVLAEVRDTNSEFHKLAIENMFKDVCLFLNKEGVEECSVPCPVEDKEQTETSNECFKSPEGIDVEVDIVTDEHINSITVNTPNQGSITAEFEEEDDFSKKVRQIKESRSNNK